MPSDVKRSPTPGEAAQTTSGTTAPAADPLPEPPSAKLIARLFIIPLLIVAAAVGIMFIIGRMAGANPSFEDALQRLRNPGGERTVDMLIGPGSKQRYMDAKTVADKIMKVGTDPAERVKISDELIEIVDKHTNDAEGDVRHFLLLALGRAWQVPPKDGPPADTAEEIAARQRAMATLLKYANSGNVSNQKAAILALAYWAGRPDVRDALPMLISKLRDESQDLDVRLAAATVLGPIAKPTDSDVIEALKFAMRDSRPENIELVWGSALSLAQLNQKDVADTILMLLDRNELAKAKVLDRETDPKNPTFHPLSDKEQERILINTMIGAAKLDVPAVQEKLRWLKDNDPSTRVRAAAQEVLQGK
ncbi:MAG: hypothetical protein QOE14_1180 [Humisphaera sp.]|nr:hypothetical protein [Humisphaera sp.]